MSGEDSIAKLLFMWSLSIGAAVSLVGSFARWRRGGDTRAFVWRAVVASVVLVGAALTVAWTVSLSGYFTETWHWLGVLFERNALKAGSALVFGLAGGLLTLSIDPPGWWPGTKKQQHPTVQG